ncbi:DUF2183 domain-containing protein [Modestobacter sp. I12A-02628]|uniref:DUF2183 domain-containing protein n=1 Tax=Goekera deserti TaxID=2497753 RepID=A0A7K3WCH3_9ACTN|nr:phosphatase domain-containing protein [Goekera deserti]MPQ98515.1 DUF2183 domain-containing protein [Goekera deserti]NDI48345.1 DUF2183 domain-containing protein [Goekera deserti]NEL54094.1 DUF2183 domain-containing protein [Goekera deserti]
MSSLPAVAYRWETGVRDLLARFARRRGWTPTVLAHPGYGSGGRVRVLGRVLLAPAGARPERRRPLPGWQRLLTLESPGTQVQVHVGGYVAQTVSDRNGLVDVTVDLPTELQGRGQVPVVLRVEGRSAGTVAHLAAPGAAQGVVCDLDDTLLVTGMTSPLLAAYRTLVQLPTRRRAVPGMSELLRELTTAAVPVPVVYLSNGPWNFAGSLARFLDRNGFPPGALLLTDWGVQPDRWFRDGRAHKRASLRRLVDDVPSVRWTLLGDTTEHDPVLYREFAAQAPDRVRAILLRDLAVPDGPARVEWLGSVPVVSGPDGLVLRDAVRALGGRDQPV